jgi:ABC-type transport system involved in multi-copper enzyme maturation permease subunit
VYLWKYWRDTRRGVYIYLGLLILFALVWLIGMYRANRIHHIYGDPVMTWTMMVGIAFSLTFLCALVMGFANGSTSVGSDMSKGTSDFLLTRPRPRRHFVWVGWAPGIGELFALIAFTAVLVFAGMTFATGPVWRQLSSPMRFGVDKGVLDLWLMVAMVLLTAAVIYGLAYFLGILLRSGQRGLIASLAIVFAYSMVGGLLKQWAGISLPSLNFAGHPDIVAPWYMTPRVEIIIWAIVGLAFPFAAQIALDRADV